MRTGCRAELFLRRRGARDVSSYADTKTYALKLLVDHQCCRQSEEEGQSRRLHGPGAKKSDSQAELGTQCQGPRAYFHVEGGSLTWLGFNIVYAVGTCVCSWKMNSHTGLPHVPTPTSKEVEDEWAQVAGETGWTPAECLEHKVTFAKRADAKAKVETLAGHMRRLRAAGWSLLSQAERWGGLCLAGDDLMH